MEFWLGSFVIYQGIRTSIAMKPYFCDFSGGPAPPLDLPMTDMYQHQTHSNKKPRVTILYEHYGNS